MEFKDRLKIIREAKHMTQTELANIIGIAPNTLNSYENTNREPRITLVIKLAKALGVSTDELLGLKDEKFTTISYNRNMLPEGYTIKETENKDAYLISIPAKGGYIDCEINDKVFEDEILSKFIKYAKFTDDIYYSYIKYILLEFVCNELSEIDKNFKFKIRSLKELNADILPTVPNTDTKQPTSSSEPDEQPPTPSDK